MVFDTVMATKEYLYWNSLVESLIRAGFIPSVNLVTGGGVLLFCKHICQYSQNLISQPSVADIRTISLSQNPQRELLYFGLARTEGAARAEPSSLEHCRVVAGEDKKSNRTFKRACIKSNYRKCNYYMYTHVRAYNYDIASIVWLYYLIICDLSSCGRMPSTSSIPHHHHPYIRSHGLR